MKTQRCPYDHDGAAGRNLGERLALLDAAIRREDERAVADFSTEELWAISRLHDVHDDEILDAMMVAREVGLALIDPASEYYDDEEQRLLEESMLIVFPEFDPEYDRTRGAGD
jgi:hypothetical protein